MTQLSSQDQPWLDLNALFDTAWDTSLLAHWFAYNQGSNIGVRVGAADFENNNRFDIPTGPTRSTPIFRLVRAFYFGTRPPAMFEGVASGIQGGLYVGA